jgi:hypothetical protein
LEGCTTSSSANKPSARYDIHLVAINGSDILPFFLVLCVSLCLCSPAPRGSLNLVHHDGSSKRRIHFLLPSFAVPLLSTPNSNPSSSSLFS